MPASSTSPRTGAKIVKQLADERPHTEWAFEYSPESFTGTEARARARHLRQAVGDGVYKPTPQKKMIINLPATVEMASANIYNADQIEWVPPQPTAPRLDDPVRCTCTTTAASAWRPRSWGYMAGAGLGRRPAHRQSGERNLLTSIWWTLVAFKDVHSRASILRSTSRISIEIRQTVEYRNQSPFAISARFFRYGDLRVHHFPRAASIRTRSIRASGAGVGLRTARFQRLLPAD